MENNFLSIINHNESNINEENILLKLISKYNKT